MRRWIGISLLVSLAMIGGTATVHAQQAWNSVLLTWTTPGDDSLTGTASQFDIRYSTAAITAANFASATRWTSGVPAPATPGSVQSVRVTGLTPGTTYWFAIKTGDDVPNWSLISNIVQKTTTAVPDTLRPAPIAIAATVQSDTSVSVQWTAVGDDSLTGTATSYDLRYSTSPITSANFASATAVSNEPVPAVAGTVQSLVVHPLQRQTTYYFAIKATDESGNVSAMSNVPSVTTTDSLAPAAITNLTVGLFWLDFSGAAMLPERRTHGR